MLSRTKQFQIQWPAFVQHFVQSIVNVGVRNVTVAATFNVELNRPSHEFLDKCCTYALRSTNNLSDIFVGET